MEDANCISFFCCNFFVPKRVPAELPPWLWVVLDTQQCPSNLCLCLSDSRPLCDNLKDCKISSKPFTVFRASSYLWGRLHSSHIDEDCHPMILPTDTPNTESSASVVCFTTHSKNHTTIVTAQKHANTPHRKGHP